jgi:galactonate dehydratase
MRLTTGFVPQAAVANSASLEHAISETRWFPVREPVSGKRYTVLRVKTRSGLTGWGECADVPEQDAKALERDWMGRSATLYAAIDRSSPLAGALDMAMLDILGKASRAPIYRVLGQNQLQALLKPLPEDRDFVLAAHESLTPGDAASVARAVETLHPLWFDEPCSASDLEALRKISAETVTPLGFERGITDPAGFLALLREGLVDVVRPDIARWGIGGARGGAAPCRQRAKFLHPACAAAG